jgi:hypothetical protein
MFIRIDNYLINPASIAYIAIENNCVEINFNSDCKIPHIVIQDKEKLEKIIEIIDNVLNISR